MSILKDTFGKDRRWVNWRPLKVKGKITKIPYSVTGRKASSTDAATWSDYKTAKASSPNIGIVFTPEQNLLGIDIDHCLIDNKIEHEQKEKIAELILQADTYTEISPSGEGLHLFLQLDAGLTLTSNKCAPFEAYTSGRYFTVTENTYGTPKEVRMVTKEEAFDILKIIGYPWKEAESKSIVTHISTPLSTDDDICTLMFRSKHGAEIRALFGGDISKYNDDYSSAEMAFCSHLAFWTRKNAKQMERIWKNSALGQREKTQKRADYRVRTVQNAIAACKEVYEPKGITPHMGGLDLLTVMDSRGNKRLVQNTENMIRILTDHDEFKDRFRYDIFKNIYEIYIREKWRTLEDNDAVVFQTRISVLFPAFSLVGKEMVYDAIIKLSKDNTIDSAADFLRSLKWDKTPRLNDWLHHTVGAPQDEYHAAVASNWLKGMVKRVIDPGSKFDYVLVLEGEQGTGKSTLLGVLGGDWHQETAMSTDSKDFFMQFQGKTIIEFSEGETLSRTEVKRMKAIITMQSDKYRPPYERSSQEFPRRCVFAMTTNQTEYLKDETGNRRWLPVRVVSESIDIKWMKENRNQLFAEAYERAIVKEESTYEFPKEETERQQAERRVSDPNADLIAHWYLSLSDSDKDYGITVHQVHAQALGNTYGGKELTKWQEMNITDILRSVLKLERRKEMKNGVRTTRWYCTDPAMRTNMEEQIEAFARG